MLLSVFCHREGSLFQAVPVQAAGKNKGQPCILCCANLSKDYIKGTCVCESLSHLHGNFIEQAVALVGSTGTLVIVTVVG